MFAPHDTEVSLADRRKLRHVGREDERSRGKARLKMRGNVVF